MTSEQFFHVEERLINFISRVTATPMAPPAEIEALPRTVLALIALQKESPEKPMENRYSTEAVAEMYQCTAHTITKWVRLGRLTAINLGGNRNGPYLFRREDLEDFERRAEIGYKEGQTA